MMEQFYRLTTTEVISLYKTGKLSFSTALELYIKVNFAPGWKIVIDREKVIEQFGISIHQFRRAIAKLKNEFDIFVKSVKQVVTTAVKKVTASVNNVAASMNKFTPSANSNRQTTSKTNTFDDPPDIRSNIDHISLSDKASGDWQLAVSPKPKPKANSQKLNALSEEEREKFLTFGRSKVNELPKRPTLPSKWIAANFEDLYSEFKLHSAPETQKTTEEKQFHEWCDLMKETGRLHRKYQPRGTSEWVLIDNCGSRINYSKASKTYTLEYLRKLVGGRR